MRELETWKLHDGWKDGFSSRLFAAKKLYDRVVGDFVGKIDDIGCGKKRVKEVFDYKDYVGYDMIGEPDIRTDVDYLSLKGGDIMLCLGILEYIDAKRFIERHVENYRLFLASYCPSDIYPNRKFNGWINSYTLDQMKEMVGNYSNVDGFHFFYRTKDVEL